MNKILLIMQRELLTRLRKRTFIVFTALMPVIMIALVAVPLWLAEPSSGEPITAIAHTTDAVSIAPESITTTDTSDAAQAVGTLFTTIIYIFILSYGSMMMQSVLEEKTGRIVEVIISCVKPWQLLWGKLLGIAALGLVQMSIWGIMFAAIVLLCSHYAPPEYALIASTMIDTLTQIDLLPIAICFVLYFIGGYFLYASFFAAIGASVNEREDTQQFMTPIVLLLIFASYAGTHSLSHPTSPLALWCSHIPLTSPIVMMVRLPFGVPLWELIVSLTLLYTTTALVAWAAGQIYRVGILLYGKKPTLLQMLRWITWK